MAAGAMVSTDGVSGRARRAGAEAGTSLGQAHRGLSPDRGSETWGHSGRVRVSWALGSWELRPCPSRSALRAALVPVPTAHLLPRRQLGWPCSRRSGEPGGAGTRDSEAALPQPSLPGRGAHLAPTCFSSAGPRVRDLRPQVGVTAQTGALRSTWALQCVSGGPAVFVLRLMLKGAWGAERGHLPHPGHLRADG